jgi:hypothetical protein
VNFLADYSYSHPFLQPLPIWDQWYLLMLPLCVAVSVVYKAIKCQSMKKSSDAGGHHHRMDTPQLLRRGCRPGGAGACGREIAIVSRGDQIAVGVDATAGTQ